MRRRERGRESFRSWRLIRCLSVESVHFSLHYFLIQSYHGDSWLAYATPPQQLERRQRLGLGTSSENHAPSRDTLPLGDDKLVLRYQRRNWKISSCFRVRRLVQRFHCLSCKLQNAPASSVAKAGKMRECLRSIRRNHKVILYLVLRLHTVDGLSR